MVQAARVRSDKKNHQIHHNHRYGDFLGPNYQRHLNYARQLKGLKLNIKALTKSIRKNLLISMYYFLHYTTVKNLHNF